MLLSMALHFSHKHQETLPIRVFSFWFSSSSDEEVVEHVEGAFEYLTKFFDFVGSYKYAFNPYSGKTSASLSEDELLPEDDILYFLNQKLYKLRVLSLFYM